VKRFFLFLIAVAAGFAGLPEVSAQTIPHVTGTFKTPANQTPAQAGLKTVATIGATAVYGSVDFQPYDSAGNKPTRILCGGITYVPQRVRAWIKGDGTLVDNATAAAGVDLVPTAGCAPTGLVMRAFMTLGGTADGRIQSVSWTEDKSIPQQASADWGALAVAGISALNYTGYATVQDEGTSLSARNTMNFIGAGVTCADNLAFLRTDCTITSGGGSGITSLNGLTGATQTFSKTDDSNVTLAITSAGSNHGFALGWTGTLAKTRQHAATVYNDQANSFGAFLQDFSAGSMKAPLSAAYAPTASGLFGYDSTANKWVFGQNGATVSFGLASSACAANQWVNTPATATAAAGCAQPGFSNLSGTASAGQIPSLDTAKITTGIFGLARGGTGADLSATGGAGQYVKQSTLGGAFSVGTIPYTDLTGAPAIYYQTLQSGGTAQTQRPAFNFIQGSNVTLTISDNPGSNRTDVTIAASVSAGARWDQLVNPTTGLSLSHGAFATTFTWGSATGAGADLFNLTDTTGNTGTGYLFNVNLASGSAAKPAKFAVNGNGVHVTNAGLLTKLGTGGIDALGISGLVPVANGGLNNSAAPSADGQIPIWDQATSKYIPGDPIVSLNYANLLNAAAATATASSASPVRLSTFSNYGTLFFTFAGITGSPAGCTVQIKSADSLGNLLNNGSAVAVTPANGTTSAAFAPAAALLTGARMSATYACATYPTAGTATLEFVPAMSVGVLNTPSVNLAQYTPVSGRLPVDGSGVTQPVSAASLPLPTGAATETTLSALNTKIPASPATDRATAAAPFATRLSDGAAFYKGTTPTDTQPVSGTFWQATQPVSGTFWQATQPVSGTVTAVGAAASGAAKSGNPMLVGGVFNTTQPTVTTGQAVEAQSTARGAVIVASGVDPIAVNNTQQGTASQNVAQFGGSAIATGTGAGGAGVPRVTISNDSSLAANQSVNVNQVGGSAVSTAATGVQKIGVVGNAGAALDAAIGAAPPANGLPAPGVGSGATGGFLTNITVCDSFVNINISTATTTLLVTGVSGRQVRICSISLIAAGADNVALISGTGATCATGTTGMTGGTTPATGYNFAANGGMAQGSGIGIINQTNATGDSVCAVTSAAVQLSGRIAYAIW